MTAARDEEMRPWDAAASDMGEASSLLLYHARRLHDPASREVAAQYLYDTYYDRLRGFFRGKGFPPETCRDLTQKTFLRVFQGRGEFAKKEELGGWVFKIAANVYRNYQRARHTQKRDAPEESLERWEEVHGAAVAEPAGRRESPLEAVLEHERRVQLARALLELPPKMRRCLMLRVGQDKTYREIADMLGISIGTVKAHLHQGKKRLKELLAPDLERDEPSNGNDCET